MQCKNSGGQRGELGEVQVVSAIRRTTQTFGASKIFSQQHFRSQKVYKWITKSLHGDYTHVTLRGIELLSCRSLSLACRPFVTLSDAVVTLRMARVGEILVLPPQGPIPCRDRHLLGLRD